MKKLLILTTGLGFMLVTTSTSFACGLHKHSTIVKPAQTHSTVNSPKK